MDQTKTETTTVAFAASASLARAIKEAAKKELCSASAICRRAVVSYLGQTSQYEQIASLTRASGTYSEGGVF